ncbi:MAG: LysR family transcriptional regulator [Pseudomonadota bacterium]
MLIRHLHYFTTLAREGHFAKAAQACNISQPALSSALRKLESDFGARLIDRDHSFLGLTPEGKRVLLWAQQILLDFESLKLDLTDRAADLQGTLRIGVVPAATALVGLLVEYFLSAHPNAAIDFQETSSRQIQTGLDSLELHGGLTYLDNEPLQRVLTFPVFVERDVVLAARGHFTSEKPVSWRQLAREPLCLLNRDMQNRRILDAAARRHRVALSPGITANSFLALSTLVQRGGWVSVVPETLLGRLGAPEDFDVRPIANDTNRHAIGLVVPDRQPMSKLTRAVFSAVFNSDIAQAFDAEQTPTQ